MRRGCSALAPRALPPRRETHHCAHGFAKALHHCPVRLRLLRYGSQSCGRGVAHERALVVEGGASVPQGYRSAPVPSVEVAQHPLEAVAGGKVEAGGVVLFHPRGEGEAGDGVLRVRPRPRGPANPQVLRLTPRPRVHVDGDGGEAVGGEVGRRGGGRQHSPGHPCALELPRRAVLLPRRPAHPQTQVLAREQGACGKGEGVRRHRVHPPPARSHRRSGRPPRAQSRRGPHWTPQRWMP